MSVQTETVASQERQRIDAGPAMVDPSPMNTGMSLSTATLVQRLRWCRIPPHRPATGNGPLPR
jgi:hypothetical protein